MNTPNNDSIAEPKRLRQGLLARVFEDESDIFGFLMTMAKVYGIRERDRHLPDVVDVVKRSVLICAQYGYLPKLDVHVGSFYNDKPYGEIPAVRGGRSYELVIGVGAYQKSFDIWRRVNQRRAAVFTEDLDLEQIYELTASAAYEGELSDDDRGAAAQLLDLEEKEVYEASGKTYAPRKFFGFWRAKAFLVEREHEKVWVPDDIPAQRSPQDVATRRATKACLMAHVPLLPVDDEEPERRLERLVTFVAAETEELEETPGDRAIMAERPWPDQDLFAAEPEYERRHRGRSQLARTGRLLGRDIDW